MPSVAVVTGGFGVLGRAVAQTLAGQGYSVALIDFAAQAQDDAGVSSPALVLAGVDLADAAAADAAMHQIRRRLGGIDALINVAGSFRWEPFESSLTSTWDLLYRTNLLTAVNASKAALPHLLKSRAGRIVNIGANSALKAGAGVSAYAASKSGVHRFTESLAEELKPHRITVNAVLPSIIDTPANRSAMPDADHSKWVAPAELAAIIGFLVSAQASASTGALLPVTGLV